MSSDPYQAWDPRSELRGLTALRGLASILVVMYHFEGVVDASGATFALGPFGALVRSGYIAVDLFFILSGVVIAHVYGSKDIGQSGADYRRFLKHRLARIYPLHVFVLLALMVLPLSRAMNGGTFFEGANSPWALLTELLLLDSLGLHDKLTWNEVSWSISAEWIAYLAAPLILTLARRGRSARSRSIASGSAAFVALLVLWAVTENDPTHDFGAVRGVLGFVIGVAVYRLHRDLPVVQLSRRSSTFVGALAAVVLLSFLAPNEALYIPSFVVLIVTSVHSSGRLATVLQSRPLVWLGKISYSVYLMQSLFLIGLVNASSPLGLDTMSQPGIWLTFIAWLAALLAISTLTYRRVEMPAQQMLRARGGSSGSSVSAQQTLRNS